jgi:DUF1680 family protein
MGLDGTTYLYNNPLTCKGGVTRKPWYAVPCCPSNLSRTWADLGKYIYKSNKDEIFIHQYISSEISIDMEMPVKICIESDLPWKGTVRISIDPSMPVEFTLNIRLPGWFQTQTSRITCNGDPLPASPAVQQNERTASGFDPRKSRWLNIKRTWTSGDVFELNFDLSPQIQRAHPKVKSHGGKVAITRGPLVYCLESTDNPQVDIFNVAMDTTSLKPVFDISTLGGVMKLEGKSQKGEPLTFIPYHLWGNRGESTMTVWVNE